MLILVALTVCRVISTKSSLQRMKARSSAPVSRSLATAETNWSTTPERRPWRVIARRRSRSCSSATTTETTTATRMSRNGEERELGAQNAHVAPG